MTQSCALFLNLYDSPILCSKHWNHVWPGRQFKPAGCLYGWMEASEGCVWEPALGWADECSGAKHGPFVYIQMCQTQTHMYRHRERETLPEQSQLSEDFNNVLWEAAAMTLTCTDTSLHCFRFQGVLSLRTSLALIAQDRFNLIKDHHSGSVEWTWHRNKSDSTWCMKISICTPIPTFRPCQRIGATLGLLSINMVRLQLSFKPLMDFPMINKVSII